MSRVFHTLNIVNFPLQIVCKVLALSALLADSNIKARAIASAIASTAGAADNAVLIHGGGMLALQNPYVGDTVAFNSAYTTRITIYHYTQL